MTTQETENQLGGAEPVVESPAAVEPAPDAPVAETPVAEVEAPAPATTEETLIEKIEHVVEDAVEEIKEFIESV